MPKSKPKGAHTKRKSLKKSSRTLKKTRESVSIKKIENKNENNNKKRNLTTTAIKNQTKIIRMKNAVLKNDYKTTTEKNVDFESYDRRYCGIIALRHYGITTLRRRNSFRHGISGVIYYAAVMPNW